MLIPALPPLNLKTPPGPRTIILPPTSTLHTPAAQTTHLDPLVREPSVPRTGLAFHPSSASARTVGNSYTHSAERECESGHSGAVQRRERE